MAKEDQPPDDPEQIALWDDFFDLKTTSIAQALGYFQIDVETKADDESPDDDVPVQHEFFDITTRPLIEQMLDWTERYFWKLKNRAARIICLKCRRYGVSTFWILFGLERILRVPGYQVLLIAQDDPSTRKHFQRLRDTFAQVPKWVLKARGIEVIKDTDSQLILRHGGFKTSEFHVAPARRNAIGRGARYNLIIVTEFPHYAKSAKKDLSGVLAACRNVRGNAIVFEATAKGFEEYHRRFMRAVKKRSDYRAQFIPAFAHPDNRKPFETVAAEEEFVKTIGTIPEFGIEDELILFRRLTVDLKWTPHDATEHLNWRRTEIADVCEGVLDYYHRENPNTPEEAFSGTGLPMFRKEILEAWREIAEAREAAAKVGKLSLKGERAIEFWAHPQGPLAIFEMPEPGEVYAFGADVASGIAQHADGKTEADFSVCIVKNVRTKVTVARYRTHVPPAEFAEAIFRLAVFYNGARGYIERAINDSGVCIDRFEDQERGDHTGYELLLSQKRDIKSDSVNLRANAIWTPGFSTTTKTKPRLVEKIDGLVKATGLPNGVKVCPWDIFFLDEAGRFERDERTGKMNAAEGHDDCVMAEGMCLEACARVEEDGLPSEVVVVPPTGDPGWAILMRHAAGVAAQERSGDEQLAENDVPGMPGY